MCCFVRSAAPEKFRRYYLFVTVLARPVSVILDLPGASTAVVFLLDMHCVRIHLTVGTPEHLRFCSQVWTRGALFYYVLLPFSSRGNVVRNASSYVRPCVTRGASRRVHPVGFQCGYL